MAAEAVRLRFFVGLHHPSTAPHFERCMVSANALRDRKSDFHPREWLLDSGAFTEISLHGRYRAEPEEYAERIERWSRCGRLLAAVSQDFMCDDPVLERAGGTVAGHQEATIERYATLRRLVAPSTHLMPVLQGQTPEDYARHVRAYGTLLAGGAWAGVGSVCGRNGRPREVEEILAAVLAERPDLRLHLFGIKTTALRSGMVRRLAHSADSMAWSFAARRQGRNANDWREAQKFVQDIENQHVVWHPRQLSFPGMP